jgi:hypothetical protein
MRRLAAWLGIPLTVLFAMLVGAAPAHASVPASHLRFIDDWGSIYSVVIQGPNQNGVYTTECMNTPHKQTDSGSMWGRRTYVKTYFNGNCQGAYQQILYIDPDGGSAYRCLSDVYPYRDWNC